MDYDKSKYCLCCPGFEETYLLFSYLFIIEITKFLLKIWWAGRNGSDFSNGYERKMKSDIRRKIRIFNELELPLLVKSGFIVATANCNTVTTNCNMNNQSDLSNTENCVQNMVGLEGPIWNFRWVAIRISKFPLDRTCPVNPKIHNLSIRQCFNNMARIIPIKTLNLLRNINFHINRS